jgi:hypothetical protein
MLPILQATEKTTGESGPTVNAAKVTAKSTSINQKARIKSRDVLKL